MDQTPATFEAALDELEGLVARLESGELPLNEALAAYRRGHGLLSFCQRQLEDVRQEIRVLEGETLKPFETDRDD